MMKLKQTTQNNPKKSFVVNDLGNCVKIQQPSFKELESLYYVLLSKLMSYNKNKTILSTRSSRE